MKNSVYRGSNEAAVIVFGRGRSPRGGLHQTVQHQARGLRGDNDARTGMPFGIPKGAMCVQRFDDSLEFCNSHYLSHFAAFFIDARTKRSVVKSFNLLIKFTQTAKLRKSLKCPPGAPARRQGRPGGNRVGQQRVMNIPVVRPGSLVMIPPQVHLRRPCYDFYFL